MPLRIDTSVLRKTDAFRKILDDKNRCGNVAKELAECLRFEFSGQIPLEEDAAIEKFNGLGICLRGDYVVKRATYKTPDLITGGFLSEVDSECVFLAECKFNAENPANYFWNAIKFNKLISEKFHVVNAKDWNFYAPEKKFFVLFSQSKSEQAKSRMRALKNALEGEERSFAELFTVCDLNEFRTYFV